MSKKSNDMLVCRTRGEMKCGCALHFGYILARKSRNTLNKNITNTQGDGREAPIHLGAAEGGALLDFFNVFLDFLAKM